MTTRHIQLPMDVELPPYKTLRAGDIQCIYESGNLRYLTVNGNEFIRLIYAAVRDENWHTASCEITQETCDVGDHEFKIAYTAIYRLNGIIYKARINIIGTRDSAISFAFNGEALSTFKKNRIGLCIHQPIKECAGKIVEITTPGGGNYRGTFPGSVSPHQPFKNIQAMKWQLLYNLQAVISFHGDIFETEDQRNWTDNSYKTYSTPLEKEFPVLIMPGEEVQQKILVTLEKNLAAFELPAQPIIADYDEKIAFPTIGIYRQHRLDKYFGNKKKNYPGWELQQYRAELVLAGGNCKAEFEKIISEAHYFKTVVALVVYFNQDYENQLRDFLSLLITHWQVIKSILPLQENTVVTPPDVLTCVYQAIKQAAPIVSIGFGTDKNFAELNRNRPVHLPFDFVVFGMQPQAHATDTRTIIENIASLPGIISSIKKFTGKPIHVSPLSFTGWQGSEPVPDQRLHTFFGSAWLLMCIKNLAGVESIDICLPPQDDQYPYRIKKNSLSPVFKVLHQLSLFKPTCIILNNKAEKQAEITFGNLAGEKLVFVPDRQFSQATLPFYLQP